MSKKGAAKVMTETGPVWCHFSEAGESIKLRRYVEGTIYEIENDGIKIEEFVPLKKCKTLVESQDGYGYLQYGVWKKVLQKLESTVSKPKSANLDPVIVPITYLRQFYETMKLLETATWTNLASFYNDNPESLKRLWNLSRNAFRNYQNDADFGQGERVALPPAPEQASKINSTDEFTAFVKKENNGFTNKTGYEFVERELNPRRTQKGFYSDKRSARRSGAGGIDVLLKSSNSGCPVIGEVKVKNDKNAFFALIQAMTYAVELSTPNQLRRLKTFFPNHFENLNPDKPKVEIALIMVNSNNDGTREAIRSLVKKLNKPQKYEGLGEVILIENNGDKWNVSG